MNELIIAATEKSPEIAIHVNPSYALYHWLRAKAETPGPNPAPEFGNAIPLMRRALNVSGLHGFWGIWENSLTDAITLDQVNLNLIHAVTSTGEALASAIAAAETRYREEIWPQQQQVFTDALSVIEQRFTPAFPAMAADHAQLLDLTWPRHIDAYLVAETYERAGAYSHPLTISVSHNTGITLCETLLHEATHVADVYMEEIGAMGLGDSVGAALLDDGMQLRAAFDCWHAVIFASSAYQMRAHIDPEHIDYATGRGLYERFMVPNAPQPSGKPIPRMGKTRNRS
ncbi:MAG: hypothetical protein ACR2OE_09535 [Thermomicrobiales bacterium]